LSEPYAPDSEREIAEEAVEALVRLARADFSVRLPRTFKKDTADMLAMFVNVIAEELDRLMRDREQQRLELERGVEQLTEAFVSLASGNFGARAPRSGKGDPLDVLGFMLDNTAVEVGEAFSEIERQRAVLEAILDSMVDGVLWLDTEGRVRRANRTAASLLGWPHAVDMVGEPFERLVAPRDRRSAAGIAAAVKAGPVRDRDVVFLAKSGEPLTLSVNASPVHAATGGLEGIVVVARDDRQLKQAQAQLQFADRLATMGTLAAGVAHEINNPLAFVTSNIDFVADELERAGGKLDAEAYEDLMKALRASQSGAERVRLIVRDLRAFSRIEHDVVDHLDLRRLLDAASNMIRNEVRHHASLEKEYGPVPPVDGNEARLVQVFLNLIQNATHAIAPGRASENEVRLITRTGESGEAIVEVRDTGTGIAPENIPQLFDAFFTTKPVGVGTGLGLAICQKIVTSLGGKIEVETEIGKGSTFRVVLPPSRATDDAVPGSRKRSVPPPPSTRTSARRRVLVVDDEPEVVESFTRLLGAAHDVVTATRGAQALQLLRQSVFDVVFCDLMMPEMSGMDLYRRLVREMPDVAERVVFMTGGTFGSGVEEFLASVDNERIEKPFDRRRILALVEAV
jgi:PAS domain S-box-containing protein